MIIPLPENLHIAFYMALGLSLALPLLLLNIKLAPRLGWVDWPKARGLSEDHVPIVGLSLVTGCFIYLGLLALHGKVSGFVLASSALIALMGYLDDRYSRPALDKILVQIFCVVCVVLFDPTLQKTISQIYGPWGTFGAIFFILGLMNSINFIDGIDGLAGSVLFFGALGLYLFSGNPQGFNTIGVFGGLLMGMLVPFLYFNVAQRKGFLGNIGSYTLSYLLALQHLSVPIEGGNIITRLAIPGLCFLVPIADAAMVLTYRLFTRRSPFQADKGHLHHRLMQSALPLRYILLVLGTIEGLGVLIAYLLKTQGGSQSAWIAPSVCFTQVITVATLIVLIEKTSKKRLEGHFSHLDQGKSIYYLRYQIAGWDNLELPSYMMKRLEARINAEIRVTDLCFIQEPNTLFVVLRNISEPFKGFSARLERIFEQERVKHSVTIEHGEFVKISDSSRFHSSKQPLSN